MTADELDPAPRPKPPETPAEWCEWCDFIARVRADERERIEKFAIPAWREEIAQEIEARIDDNPYYEPWREAMEFAAAIARGGAQ